MFQLTPLDNMLYVDRHDLSDINKVELSVLNTAPFMSRILTAQKPVMIQGTISKNHNPDFILNDAIFVEVKGYIRDSMYRPMIADFPLWLKRRYHVIIVSTGDQAGELKRFCDKHNVSCSIGPIVPLYIVLRSIELGSMTRDDSIVWTQ